MKKVNWFFLILSIIAALLIVFIGFAIGAGNLIAVILCAIGIIIVFGIGFAQKKKMRENGTL